MSYYPKGSHRVPYVYMTEHVETGEFYVGSHECSSHRNPEKDGYYGSGGWIKANVKFHCGNCVKWCGQCDSTQKDYSHLRKHIITFCETRKAAYEMEDSLLRDLPFNPLCRNRWVNGRYKG